MMDFTPFDGVLLVDKPKTWTSHDVVAKVRGHFRFKKVGHCGTLDPMATGLLVLVLGRATKLSERLMGDDKTYEGTMQLGVTTNTADCDGQVTATHPVPAITEAQMLDVMSKFKGDIYQTPPMVSAIKYEGKPLYKLARKGIEIEREPRLIHIYDLRLRQFNLPNVGFVLTCSKGTYVRTIASDIGTHFGCGAHLTELRRTVSGKFSIENAHTLEQILAKPREQLAEWVLPILEVARGLAVS